MRNVSQKLYKGYVFVCENRRDDGRESCGVTVLGLREALKEAVKIAGLPVRVIGTSCLGYCLEGPIVALFPMNEWYGDVSIDDVPAIVMKMQERIGGI